MTPGHYANIGENDTLLKDREPQKTIPYSAARTYIAHIGEYPPRVYGAFGTWKFSSQYFGCGLEPCGNSVYCKAK